MDKELEHSVKAATLELKEEPMKDYYDNLIAGYPSRLRVRKVLKELGDVKGKRVLDIGCEEGYVSFKIIKKEPAELYAMDIIQEALDTYRENLSKIKTDTKVFTKRAFLQKMPFKSDFFDAAVCTEVIEHAPHIEKGFKEMARVLKKGGRLVITFPNEPLRRIVYPIVKMLGVNTDVEKDVTLFDRDPKHILTLLAEDFDIKKFYRFPFYFPMTNMVVCVKR